MNGDVIPARRGRVRLAAALTLGLLAAGALAPTRATADPKKPAANNPKAAASKLPLGTIPDAAWKQASLAALQPGEIDALISRELQPQNVKLAPRTTDEQFLRRVYLDL